MEKSEFYNAIRDSYEVNNYPKGSHDGRELKTYERKRFDEFVGKVKLLSRNVLDIGCGDGSMYVQYLLSSDLRYTGIDTCERLLRTARKYFKKAKFKRTDFLEASIPNEKYAGILCIDTFHHFHRDDMQEALQKMWDMLLCNGVVLMTLCTRKDSGQRYNDDWCGTLMYWDFPGYGKILEMCDDIGFEYRIYKDVDDAETKWVLLKKVEED